MWASWAEVQGVELPLHLSPVDVSARITLPLVAPIEVLPIASGIGSDDPAAPSEASCIR